MVNEISNRLFFAVSLVLLTATQINAAPRERLSFNEGWQFARFGLQPDGTRVPEPGANAARFSMSASSAESGHRAEFGMDGNADTRWCADGDRATPWLAIDLGGELDVSRADVQWEFPDSPYGFVIERSVNGMNWEPLPGRARHIRVRITSLPAGKWASIREVKLFDGKRPGNLKPAHLHRRRRAFQRRVR